MKPNNCIQLKNLKKRMIRFLKAQAPPIEMKSI